MNLPEFIKVKVFPSSKSPGASRISDDKYEVRVGAPAKDGAANREMMSRLGEIIFKGHNIKGYRMTLVSGALKSSKIVRIGKIQDDNDKK